MKTVTVFPDGTMVTGSSGSVGSSLCADYARRFETAPPASIPLDVTRPEHFRRLPGGLKLRTVVNLAVRGGVLRTRAEIGPLFEEAIAATVNVLDIVKPEVFILSSSCAVYGDTDITGAPATQKEMRPRSAYAMAKATVELITSQWASETGTAAVIFRFGNVVGKGCYGLIAYLSQHAMQYPEGERPMRLRGGGRILRDYVPLSHVTKVLAAAVDHSWVRGSTAILNMGTGRGLTNGAVAERVQRVIARRGYRLNIEWDSEPSFEETSVSVLEVTGTERILGIRTPSAEEVWEAIEDAVVTSCV
jgi:nucleoside-diphosphate-sugar epimerase